MCDILTDLDLALRLIFLDIIDDDFIRWYFWYVLFIQDDAAVFCGIYFLKHLVLAEGTDFFLLLFFVRCIDSLSFNETE